MEKVFITGGSGFFGTNLIDLLVGNDKQILNYDKKTPLNIKDNIYWKNGNILNEKEIVRSMKEFKPKYVIHLAARTDTNSNFIDDYFENTQGTKNVLNAVKKTLSVKRFIMTSTQYVYKSKEHPFPVTDRDYRPHTSYGKSKVIAEEIVRNTKLNCIWTIVRPANIWGPWHMRYSEELWKMIARGFYVHPGNEVIIRTYGYIKNVVHQIDAILKAPKSQIDKQTYYLGDLPIDSYFWLDTISQTLRGKSINRVPWFLLKFTSIIGDVLCKTGIKFPLNSIRFHNMTEDYYAPTNVTIREFGLSHPDLKKNVEETFRWLKKDYANGSKYWKNWFLKQKNS